MKLPFFKNKLTPNPSREYIFALEIGITVVKSSVWAVVNDKVQTLAVGPVSNWDSVSLSSLITACDESLSGSTRKLDPTGKSQPEKVLLGLPAHWVVEDKIQPDQQKMLRGLTKELSLKAVGFVITPQAMVRYLHSTENVLPTAILIEISTASLAVALIRLGKLSSIETVQRSEHLGHDLAEGLSRLDAENMLPSRMLIYGSGQNLETSRQDILSFAWQAPQYKLPFLHFPKVEILPENFSIQAISHAGGGEVAQATGMTSQTQESQDQPVDMTDDFTPVELGFYPDIDLAESSSVEKETPVIVEPKPSHPGVKVPAIRAPSFKIKLPQLPIVVIPLFVVILILGLIFWLVRYKTSAEIVLTFTPQTRDYDLELTADPGTTQSDPAAGLLPATQVSHIIKSDKAAPTTGSKIVGDKASGEVSLINGTSVPRLFAAGTVITSPSGLQFSLDTSVEVASASGTADPNSYQPGKSNAKVTALVIGSDSNLSAGTQFRVASFSSLDYVARNDGAFVGGSSRQVRAVSKQDISNLKTELTDSLSATAKSELISSQDDSRIVIPDSITVKVDQESVDFKADEVSDSVTMELTIKAVGLSIIRSDLEQIVSERISSETPVDFYQYQPVDYEFGIRSSEGDKAKVAVNATTHLLPKVDYEQVKQQITGKKISTAESYLKTLNSVSSVNLNIKPKIFSWFGFLPYVKQNIRFTTNPS